MLLEIACFSLEAAILAHEAGAGRIELCSGSLGDGLTPSAAMIKLARKYLDIPLHVMIRPREGDFLYTANEIDSMLTDISIVKKYGTDGIVIGLLKEDGTVDIQSTSRLVEAAYPMKITFHRAFDLTRDPLEALGAIIQTGAHRILTSGQKATATEGRFLIAELIRHSHDKIIIMPGSGVNASNIVLLQKETGASEFHASVRKTFESKMKFQQKNVKLHAGMDIHDNSILLPDQDQIRKMSHFLRTMKK